MSEITKKSDEQKGAEAEVQSFRDDLGPFVVAADTTRMAMVFTDATEPDNPIIFANDSFLSLTGYNREEVLGKSFNFLMAHAADAEALARIKAEFEGSSNSGTEILYRRKDGSEFWSAVFISPVRDAGGDIIQYFASFADLTKHKDDEVRSRMLIDELNHRVKNILSTVQSIVWQTLRTTTDPKAVWQSIEKGSFGHWHLVQGACDECCEIRCIVKRDGLNPDRVDDRDCTGRKAASSQLEGEGWPPSQATGAEGLWVACDRTWSGP